MAGVPSLGTIVATQEGPTALEFEFIVSEESARQYIESGSFVQSKQVGELVLGMVQRLRRVNRYYSSPDIIHGSSNGVSLPSVYPADKWDYVIASVKVLGSYKDNLQIRATRPVLPGSLVEFAENEILQKFLGLSDNGLQIGKVRQSELEAIINLDKLLQKHLAILSISGGGKSYATSVIIEELMRRSKLDGRPAMVIFDVHGEYKQLTKMPKHSEFRSSQVERIPANKLSLAMGYLSSSDLRKFFPTMSYAQSRELDNIMRKLRIEGEPITIQKVVKKIFATEMNQLVKDALLGWLNMLQGTRLFSNVENPNLESSLAPGKLVIIDLSSITTLWTKQIIVHYFLSRIFELRRSKDIPPVIS
ncbi:MAG: ATP-binding protein, partial [Candidatus Heimdallarchaeota archaeon]